VMRVLAHRLGEVEAEADADAAGAANA